MPSLSAIRKRREQVRAQLQRDVGIGRVLALVLWTILLPDAVLAQDRARVVLLGQVVSATGDPVVSALVSMAGANGDTVRTVTDSVGRFWLVLPQPALRAAITVSALGWHTYSQTVVVEGRPGGRTRLQVRLQPAPVALPSVVVEAQRRPRPTRRPGSQEDEPTGAATSHVVGVAAGLSPELEGDIEASVAKSPGMLATPDGLATLGLPAEQMATTLGGMRFAGTRLPKGLRTLTRIVGTTYDPARGGFSAAEVAVNLVPGDEYTRRHASIVAVPSALQLSGLPADGMAQRPNVVKVALSGSGPLVGQSVFYTSALQVGVSSAPVPSLVSSGASALNAYGLQPDSVARFAEIARQQGVPLDRTRSPFGKGDQQLTGVAQLDYAPRGRGKANAALTAYLDWNGQSELGASPNAAVTYGGHSAATTALIAGKLSQFVAATLTETKVALTYQRTSVRPYSNLPTGVLEMGSAALNGPTGFLLFGGQQALRDDRERLGAQGSVRTWWHSRGARHKYQLFLEGRLDDVRANPGGQASSFTYSSLGDLASARPSEYTFTAQRARERGRSGNWALALSDSWLLSERLNLVYGTRVDGNHFLYRPNPNPAVQRLFGLSTDYMPGSTGVSPRVGFNWVIRPTTEPSSTYSGPLGYAERTPQGVLRGGVGVFRNVQRVDPAVRASGLTGNASDLRQLNCIGPAVPAAKWSEYVTASVEFPQSCADAVSSVWIADAPPVFAYVRGYTPEYSIRGSLALDSRIPHVAHYSVEYIHSLNRAQPSTIDRNLALAPSFWLPGEGRPVFVPATAIDPAMGGTALTNSRRYVEFGNVSEYRSDMRSQAQRLTLTAEPDMEWGRYALSATYVWSRVTEWARGFDRSTASDPRQVERSASPISVTHTLWLQAGMSGNGSTLSAFLSLMSGRPFTPMVGSDINGDGYANDRAFVFDPPSRTASLEEDTAMAALVENAPAHVRQCLTSQYGRVARRASCRGPWTAELDLRWELHSPSFRILGRRGGISVTASNLMSGIDWALHGSQMVGWGSVGLPDQVLLHVRGFDPASERFQYTLNPRFGRVPAGLAMPARIAAEVRLDLGRSRADQQISRWGPKRRGGALTADSIRTLYAKQLPDPYSQILMAADSLALEPWQIDSLRAARRAYIVTVDSLAGQLAAWLTTSAQNEPRTAARAQHGIIMDAAWAALWRQRVTISHLLSVAQYSELPFWMRVVFSRPQAPKDGEFQF